MGSSSFLESLIRFLPFKKTNTGCYDLIGMIESYHKETFAISHCPLLIGMHPSGSLKKLKFQPYLYLCTLYLWVLLGLWKPINKDDHIIGAVPLTNHADTSFRSTHGTQPWVLSDVLTQYVFHQIFTTVHLWSCSGQNTTEKVHFLKRLYIW